MSEQQTLERLLQQRRELHLLDNEQGIMDYAEACQFVSRLGVVMPWANQGYPLPSLRAAYRGQVTREPGPIWDWKDQMPAERVAYYGSILAKGKVLLSPSAVPAFYRASGRSGDAEDYQIDYDDGSLSFAAKQTMDLLQAGPCLGPELKRRLQQLGVECARLTQDLDDLQRRFYITKVDVLNAGQKYGYVWGLVDTHWPEMVRSALAMSKRQARGQVIAHLVAASVYASEADLRRMTGWSPAHLQDALQAAQQLQIATLVVAGETLYTSVELASQL